MSRGKASSPSLLVLRDAEWLTVSSPPSQSRSLFHCASRSHSLPPSLPLSLSLQLSSLPFWRHLRSSFSHNTSQHTALSLSLLPSFQCSPSFLIILFFLHTLKMFPHSKIIKDFHLSLLSPTAPFYYPSFSFPFLLQVTYTDQCPSAAMPAPWLQLPGISVSQDPPSQQLTWCNKQEQIKRLREGGFHSPGRISSPSLL